MRRQEKKAKEGDPQSATPALRYGANLRRCGCGVRRGTSFAAAQRRSDNHGESDDEAWALRRPCHPATAPPQAQPAGGLGAEQPNSHSGLRYARPDQRAALAPEAQGRAKQWPEWMSAPHPLCMRRGAQRAGWRVCRRTHALRELTRRSCPSGARERAASSAAHPAREHHRLPRSEAQGTQTVGSPFLCLLSFGEAKESESPAGAITRLLPKAKALTPNFIAASAYPTSASSQNIQTSARPNHFSRAI